MTRLDDLNLDPVRPSQTGPKRVIVMQGISGSGKSVLARKLAEAERRPGRPGGYVVSADDYFYRLGGGVYKYEFSKIGEAHDECFRNFMYAIMNRTEGLVIVDNTNTVVADVAPYMRAASAWGWEAKIVRVVVDVETAFNRNGGRAPMKVVMRQAENLQRETFPRWWVVETVQAEF
jgi:predicted kinase